MTTNTDIQIRNYEYYGLIDKFDTLYAKSKDNVNHKQNLYDLVLSKENILCAYRSVKTNKGSKTQGEDTITIDDLKEMTEEDFVTYIRNQFKVYNPDKIRRVEIPKQGGGSRPLGIPTMKDRIIQQCIKQVIEPVVEAKFHNHSYGFRPNRSAKHAVARCQFLINISKLHYVVDIDIKSFFDNVNHNKLIKLLYKSNVRDKRILQIIKKMLKAEVLGLGVQDKGTPRGGILSPLLSNVYLNELDWWVSNQFETFETKNEYSRNDMKIRSLRKRSKLKQMYIVRYADDFKIFTNSYNSAFKIKQATTNFLNKRLNLDISTDKSKITNLKKNKSDFLGFSIKAIPKKGKYVARTGVSKKSKERIFKDYKRNIVKLSKSNSGKDINNFNSYVIGVKNYYKFATNVYLDLVEIEFKSLDSKYNRLRHKAKKIYPRDIENLSPTFDKYCSKNYITWKFKQGVIHTFTKTAYTPCQNFNQKLTRYTKEGRQALRQLKPSIDYEIQKLLNSNFDGHRTIEYVDNRIAKYSMQKGRCRVTKRFLIEENIHCHHIIPKHLGGSDEFKNLVIVSKDIHQIIHLKDTERIKEKVEQSNLSKEQINKINKLRIISENEKIEI